MPSGYAFLARTLTHSLTHSLHSRASGRRGRSRICVNYRDPALIRHSRSLATSITQIEREIRRSRSRDRSRRSLGTAISEKFEIHNNLINKKSIEQPSATRGWYPSRRGRVKLADAAVRESA